MKWCFGFPYCPNEPFREEAFEVVTRFYDEHFPEVPKLVHSATEVGEPFLRAKTRNELVKQAAGFDLIVLVDADTLIPPEGIRAGVEKVAAADNLVVKPFLRGVNADMRVFGAVARGGVWPRARFHDPGAAWIVRPETWWAAGGMDENFTGWGGEDDAHAFIHAALGGRQESSSDLPAVKFNHPYPRWRRAPGWRETDMRQRVCMALIDRENDARQWLLERDQPGAVEAWIDRLGIRDEVAQSLARRGLTL